MSRLSFLLISLERSPEHWAELQFKHVARFPEVECSACHETACFSCGVTPFHKKKGCQDYMKEIVSLGNGPEEVLQTILWKMTNSKMCPNCSVLITREEGCNKVDCLQCGHKFCWNCLNDFRNGACSFYRCKVGGIIERPGEASTEVGVPDIMKLQSNQAPLAH